MKKNIFKIIIIILCFVFIVAVAFYEPKSLIKEESHQKEEVPEYTSEEEPQPVEEPELIKLENNPKLRVLITSENFVNDIHPEVRVTSNRDFELLGEDGTLFAEYNAWEEIDLDSFR